MSGGQPRVPRVLVVRSEALRDRVAAAMQAARLEVHVESSPSYLSAMGWLTSEHVDAVIGPVSGMTGMVGSTARGLRKLAPGTRLIAVADGQEHAEAGAAMTAGFDECVYEPADATTLLASLRLAQVGVADDVDDAGSVESAQEQHTPESAPADEQPGVEEPFGLPGMDDWLRFGFDDPVELPPIEGVGDVDLAEAVMRDDGTLLPMAMGLLREQSALKDASFVSLEKVDQAPQPAVDVAHGGRLYGVLSSASADIKALGSWAAWLSRWVALDQRQSELYTMAMRDELTGLWNRRYFDRFLARVLEHAANGRQQVTLLVFDIDNFKLYNDNYGHPAGDEILRSTATLIQSLVREHDVVARIGGDEFAVVFWDKGEPRHLGSQHPDSVIGIAKRFQKAICEHRFPKLGEEAVGQLTVSGGLAGFPWDGRTPDELMARADAMAMQSKRQGKNAICFGPGAAPNGKGGGGESHV